MLKINEKREKCGDIYVVLCNYNCAYENAWQCNCEYLKVHLKTLLMAWRRNWKWWESGSAFRHSNYFQMHCQTFLITLSIISKYKIIIKEYYKYVTAFSHFFIDFQHLIIQDGRITPVLLVSFPTTLLTLN